MLAQRQLISEEKADLKYSSLQEMVGWFLENLFLPGDLLEVPQLCE